MTFKKRTAAPQEPDEIHSEGPPFFSTWPRMYAFVLSFLGILILLFYLFMKSYT